MSRKRPKNFLSDGLSIDETRISALIFCYLLSFIITLIMCVITKDMEGLKQLCLASIAAITGINITSSVINGISNKHTQINSNDSNQDFTTINEEYEKDEIDDSIR